MQKLSDLFMLDLSEQDAVEELLTFRKAHYGVTASLNLNMMVKSRNEPSLFYQNGFYF